MSKTSSMSKNKWNEKAYDRISLTVAKGDKDRLKQISDKLGYSSLNSFINAAIKEKIEKQSI